MAATIPVGLKIVGTILLVGLAARFAKKKVATTDDSKPATLTDRGVRVPVVIGRTRGGPIHALETDRFQSQEPFSGGAGGKGVGGSGGTQNDVYFASGWHILCVGPANRLIEVYDNGELILDKPTPVGFDPITLPSGSVIPLKPTEEGRSRGTARIYWGEPDQPTDPYLSLPNSLGYTSNHKYIFHIVWEDRRLGGAGTWPALEYEYEVRPFNPGQVVGVAYDSLTPQLGAIVDAGDPWLANSLGVPTGASCFNILLTDEGPPGSVKVFGNQTVSFPAGGFAKIQNAGSGVNGNYEIQSSSYNPVEEILPPGTATADRRTNNVPTPGNGWPTIGIGILNDSFATIGASGGPPGVVVQPFGANGGLPVTAAFTWPLPGSCVRAQPLGSNPDPDPGSAGNNVQFNDGYNYFTSYVRASTAGPLTQIRLSFVSQNSAGPTPAAGRQHGVSFNTTNNFLQPGSFVPFGGATATITDLGTSLGPAHWYRVVVRYRAGDGGITVATDPCWIQYEIISGSPGNNFIFVHGEGQGGTVPKWQYRDALPFVGITTILLTDTLFGTIDFSGQICPLSVNENGFQGANGAHIIHQLLFEEAPHGLGLVAACYDTESLQALGLLLDAPQEGIRSHITVPDSTTLDAVVQALLEELGVHLAWDVTTAKWTFVPVRRKLSPDGVVEREIITPDLPSRRRRLGEEYRTKLVFLYPNVELRYRTDALTLSEDGRATQELREDGQKITLRTVRDPAAAAQIGELRSLWEFSKPSAYTIYLNRDAVVLRPGDLLDFGELLGIDTDLRVMALQPSGESAVVMVTCLTDPYAEEPISSSSFLLGGSGGPGGDGSVVEEDCQQRLYELSAFLGREIQFTPLRVPLNFPTKKASLYASADGVNFQIEDQVGYVSGGTVAIDYPASFTAPESDSDYAINQYHIEEGPFISSCNEEFAQNILSLSDPEWVSGRQMLVVGGPNNTEVMYVREFLPYGGTLWQARGVLRARLDTPLRDIAFGDEAYVVIGGPTVFQKTKILTAGRALDTHWKLVPFGVSPGLVTATVQEVQGDGIKPMPISNFTTRDFTAAWAPGIDLTLRWDYRVPQGLTERSGSGMQGYGEPTGSSSSGSAFPGFFRLVLIDSAATAFVVPTFDVTEPTWTITAAALASAIALAGLPPDVDLRADLLPVYSTGEIGSRLQLEIPFAG